VDTYPSNLFAGVTESTTITELPVIYARVVSTVNETLPPNSGAGGLIVVAVIVFVLYRSPSIPVGPVGPVGPVLPVGPSIPSKFTL
jgi:predicted RND superfamily exporter protein